MCKERVIFFVAGTLALSGTALTLLLNNSWWLILPGFVGLNMLQSSLTGFCPLSKILNGFKVPACAGGPTA